MAYIPTIKTFEDEVNENRRLDETPIEGRTEKINYDVNPLVPEKKESSLTKKILIFLAVLLIAASLALLGYYFYNNYLEKENQAALILEAERRQAEVEAGQEIQNELSKILPKLAPGISPYILMANQRNNVIILTIKDTTEAGADSFSSLYSYILAHEKDLNSDLFYAFKIEELRSQNLQPENNETTGLGDSFFSNNSSGLDVVNDTDPSESSIPSYNNPYTAPTPSILGPYSMSSRDLVWERKTLNNQDFETADAGVTTLFYGYINKKYLVMTTYQKDLFEIARSLQ